MKFILIISVTFLLLGVHFADAHGKDGKNHGKKPDHGKGGHHPKPTIRPTEAPLTEPPPTEPPTTEPPEESTTKPPVQGVCPKTCRHSFCKKKTAFTYEVIDIKEELKEKIIYNIRLISKFKGLPSSLQKTTLEVPKSNKKHKIQLKKKFLFLCNVDFKNNLVLQSGCFNKHLSLLSFIEQVFLSHAPIDYCKKKQIKGECHVKKCEKKCFQLCKDCDDEETCEDDCRIRCKQVAN